MIRSNWSVFYWKSRDKIVIGNYNRGLIDYLSEDDDAFYFSYTHTRSRMPKTLVYLGEF